MTLWVGASCGMSPHLQVCEMFENVMFFTCHVTLGNRFSWTSWVEATHCKYHASKFGSFRHYHSGDIFLNLSRDLARPQVIKGSCNFMNGSFTRYVTFQPRLVAIGITAVEMVLICHVTMCLKLYMTLNKGSPHRKLPPYHLLWPLV